jgi:hypothetical protein
VVGEGNVRGLFPATFLKDKIMPCLFAFCLQEFFILRVIPDDASVLHAYKCVRNYYLTLIHQFSAYANCQPIKRRIDNAKVPLAK